MKNFVEQKCVLLEHRFSQSFFNLLFSLNGSLIMLSVSVEASETLTKIVSLKQYMRVLNSH